MNIYRLIILIVLSTTLCALGQTDITVEITDTADTNDITPVMQNVKENQPSNFDEYENCLSYLNPRNNADTMAQWTVINPLFRTNNIRIGITMCSLECRASIHVDDVERARTILNKAIKDKRIDNNILKMKIETQQPVAPNDAPRRVAGDP